MHLIKLFIVLICSRLSIATYGQDSVISDYIQYFDQQEEMDPIEGIWTVNVTRSLYFEDSLLVTQFEEIVSEWAIVKVNKLEYQVKDINRRGAYDQELAFRATFEKTAVPELYSYYCDFTSPVWTARANAMMDQGRLIEISYWVGEEYMKHYYSDSYVPGLRLHWDFLWIKKYPIDEEEPNVWQH